MKISMIVFVKKIVKNISLVSFGDKHFAPYSPHWTCLIIPVGCFIWVPEEIFAALADIEHTLATRSCTFGNMFYFCFVSWQDIIGQVRLLYNGPLYAAVCSGPGYQFLGGFALVWESSKSATLVLSQTPPSDVWVRYSVPLGFTQIKLTKILNTSKNQHIWQSTGPDLCHKTQAYVNIKAEMPLCHLPKTHFSGVLL